MELPVRSDHHRTAITRAVALAPLAIVLVVGLVACGGGGSNKTVAAPATTTTVAGGGGGANRAALQAFTACLTQHGVTVPTFAPRQRPSTTLGTNTTVDNGGPPGGGGGFGGGGGRGVGTIINSTDPATKAAVAACQDKLPAGFLQQLQQGQTALNAYRSCMQSHGVTVGQGFRGGGGSTTTTTPAFTAANNICKALLPARGAGGPGGAGAGSTPPTSAAQ